MTSQSADGYQEGGNKREYEFSKIINTFAAQNHKYGKKETGYHT